MKHALDALDHLLPDGCRLAVTPVQLAGLSEHAVEARYPGPWPEASLADAAEAVALAEIIYQATSLSVE